VGATRASTGRQEEIWAEPLVIQLTVWSRSRKYGVMFFFVWVKSWPTWGKVAFEVFSKAVFRAF